MEFILKGLTSDTVITQVKAPELHQYSFDLRPKSFNFTQAYNIKKIIEEQATSHRYSLMFENEKDLIVTEMHKDISKSLKDGDELLLEFSGTTGLDELEKFQLPYIWHYHEQEKIRNITSCNYLKRIVFHHQDLEVLNSNGELHGFFNLFSDYSKDIYFEVQLEWDSNIILSLFDFFTIPILSFEISHMVEVSYQNPDTLLIQNHIQNIAKLFEQKVNEDENSHNE